MQPAQTRFDKVSTNICKGMAILLMYVHHSFGTVAAYEDTNVIFFPLSEPQTLWLGQVCKVCVAIFVLLSGFGVYRSTRPLREQETYLQYYSQTVKRRCLHLLGGFVFIYLCAMALSWPIGRSPAEIYGDSRFMRLFYQVIDGLGLAKAFGTPTYNGTWWYMSLAYILIFVLPLLAAAADKIGWGMLPVVILIPLMTGVDMKLQFWWYLPTAILGVLCAKYEIFERIGQILRKGNFMDVLWGGILVFAIATACYCRQRLGSDCYFLTESVLAVLICLFCFVYLQHIPGLNRAFAFMGKHSMNMFLIHTLIRTNTARLHQFSYSPRYPALIILLLVADTLLLSVVIEWIKKWGSRSLRFGWNKLRGRAAR